LKELRTVIVTETDLPLDEIGEHYGDMRIVVPRAEQQMLQSLRRYGQMSPVVVCRRTPEGHELIDGFKRLRAGRQIGSMSSMRCRVLEIGERAAKAAMLCLNWVSRGVSDLEEAWVVHSLCREDGLTQVEVGQLLGRDKSWVCRRLWLVEKLSDEVQSQIRLGLLSATVGREVARLPRGNQERVLEAAQKHRLGSREVAGLVDVLLQKRREEHEGILHQPRDTLTKHGKWRRELRDERLSAAGNRILRGLTGMDLACRRVVSTVGIKGLSELRAGDLSILAQPIGRAQRASRQATQALEDALEAAQEDRHVSVRKSGGTGATGGNPAQGGMVGEEACRGPEDQP
jgi:ParB/RepB/Spo0J family partition protein